MIRGIRSKRLHFILTVMMLTYIVVVLLTSQLAHQPSMDEYIFAKITRNLPNYYSSAEWAKEWYSIYGNPKPEHSHWKETWDEAYNNEVWVHPPLANVITYPIVAITDNFKILKGFASLIILTGIASLLFLVYKRRKSITDVMFALFPLAFGAIIIFYPLNLFYHDIIMVMFLVIALILRESRFKRFIYIPLALMVLTKIYAVIFLIPFIMENRKLSLCSLSLIPYLLWVWISTGEIFYLINHWVNMQEWLGAGEFTRLERLTAGLLMISPFLALSFPMFIYSMLKRNIFYPILYVLGLIVFFGWAPYYYHLSPGYLASSRLLK